MRHTISSSPCAGLVIFLPTPGISTGTDTFAGADAFKKQSAGYIGCEQCATMMAGKPGFPAQSWAYQPYHRSFGRMHGVARDMYTVLHMSGRS